MTTRRTLQQLSILAAVLLSLPASPSYAVKVRVKDITTMEGQRINILHGVGLVSGLAGTGGKSPYTRQSLANAIARLGVRVEPSLRAAIPTNNQLKTNNVSVVLVTAKLPVNSVPGQPLDVTISTLDDASSLRGGVLAQTPLIGADGNVYALAAGEVTLAGGFTFGGQAANASKAHSTTGKVIGGGIVEKATPIDFPNPACTHLLLLHPDITTAQHVVDAVNQFSPGSAQYSNDTVILVRLPASPDERGSFLSQVGNLIVEPDQRAVVSINDRTGTVVIGHQVRISAAAIAHGSLSVVTGETPQVSQPAPFSQGATTVVPRTEIEVTEEKRPISVFEESTTVGDLASALNALGVSPGDISAIFQQLYNSGALQAELVFN